ncbi:hypothetical protein AR158_c514R [Paramecium bursaria Chlorella virus AR158]|uniref:hypothetical protein n=1 Tax=Paramecium bursaria Chlorella virus AR158 TaxID=380598 RepID=UPI00015AA730|nr:hypothetical protein AR158_c514R [Paramecium bursaria Chlorella virus AR158]ABU44059.1 hypothetical protein AR158_c514R [Paramecium bursaria Chlorella virus AR158]
MSWPNIATRHISNKKDSESNIENFNLYSKLIETPSLLNIKIHLPLCVFICLSINSLSLSKHISLSQRSFFNTNGMCFGFLEKQF